MLTLDQLTCLREVCLDACYATSNVYKTDKATAALADIDAEIELLKGGLTDCVTLQVGRDGVWAHFRVGKGYAYSQNLSAELMSKKFADEYIAKLKGTP